MKIPYRMVVGPGKARTRPSQAAREAKDGDVVEIEAGTYSGDAAVWTQNDLTIRAIGGRVHLEANGASAEGKAIWVIKGRNTTIEDIEFSGARVRDGNGAGIRQEGANLTLRHCYFHDNEEGILTGANPQSSIVIERSEFADNGAGDGRTHNIYIGEVKSFTLRASYSHGARIGHNVKSRAHENFILYNRIADEQKGTASYAVDLPNGGLSILIGNVIEQGPHADNSTIIAYGAEGLRQRVNQLLVVNNTIVNDYPGGRFLFVSPGARPAQIVNNVLAGPGTVLAGPGALRHNLHSDDPGFVDRRHYNYHLTAGSAAIDAGIDPGRSGRFSLTPVAEPSQPFGEHPRPRRGPLDLGAYEYRGAPSSSGRGSAGRHP